MIIRKKDSKRLFIGAIALILVILITAYLFLAHNRALWPFMPSPVTSSLPSSPSLLPAKDDPNGTDPTYSTAKDQSKSNPSSTSGTPDTQATNQKKTVGVAITYTGPGNDPSTIEVQAFVSGIIEGTGTCTASLTSGSVNITSSSPAFIDATTTQCEPMIISRAKLSSGQWSVSVHYDSPTSTGTSQDKTITI